MMANTRSKSVVFEATDDRSQGRAVCGTDRHHGFYKIVMTMDSRPGTRPA